MMSGNASPRFSTPVLFLIFCRPDKTRLVFEAIRDIKPTKLYVAADGPRDQNPEDIARCAEARQIATAVDWDCEVHTLFREKNFGCGPGPSTAISWFFEHEPEGIILEDDCIPSRAFFSFCAELLNRYRNDTRIMQVAGSNFERNDLRETEYSYRFSSFTCSWGWASWRRAWKLHDFHMELFEEVFKKKYLEGHYNSIYERDFFQYVFSETHRGDRRNVWDYQWQFACRIHSGLIIMPARNLVVNTGFGKDATNTSYAKGIGTDLKFEVIDFPLKHPEFVMTHRKRDSQLFSLSWTSGISRMKSNIKQIIPDGVVKRLKAPMRSISILVTRKSQSI